MTEDERERLILLANELAVSRQRTFAAAAIRAVLEENDRLRGTLAKVPMTIHQPTRDEGHTPMNPDLTIQIDAAGGGLLKAMTDEVARLRAERDKLWEGLGEALMTVRQLDPARERTAWYRDLEALLPGPEDDR